MGSDLDELLVHTCSVVAAAETTSGEDNRPSMGWTGGVTTSAIPCRLSETTMQTRAELATLAVQASHELWMAWSDAPASVKTATAERSHRITNVLRRENGSNVDAGPFDLKHVANVGGADELLKLLLLRIG